MFEIFETEKEAKRVALEMKRASWPQAKAVHQPKEMIDMTDGWIVVARPSVSGIPALVLHDDGVVR